MNFIYFKLYLVFLISAHDNAWTLEICILSSQSDFICIALLIQVNVVQGASLAQILNNKDKSIKSNSFKNTNALQNNSIKHYSESQSL